MSNSSPNTKSPFLAGLFGIFPGMGHFYAGNAGKGIILFGLLLLLLCLFSPLSIFFQSSPFSGYHMSFNSNTNAGLVYEYSGSYFEFHSSSSWFSFLFLAGGVLCVVYCFSKKFAAFLLGLFVVYLMYQFVNFRSFYYTPYKEVHVVTNSFPVFQTSLIQFISMFLLLPILLLYSIADAAVTAVQYNRFMQFGGSPPTPLHQHDNQPEQQNIYYGNSEQDAVRRGARERGLPV